MLLLSSLVLLGSVSIIDATCHEPSPAFPVPAWKHGRSDLDTAWKSIQTKIDAAITQDKYNKSSYSLEVTSSAETLWQSFHTAQVQNDTRPGDQNVDESSLYRIASITKAFTTLAILKQDDAGNLSLDDPVSDYIAELNGDHTGSIPWKDISLRTLAGQLSGIPRDFAQGDVIDADFDPITIGFPPRSKAGLPACDEYSGFKSACNRTDLLDWLKENPPLFAPHQKSTYSNLNSELLGLVLENVTGVPFTTHIEQAIFAPLGMDSSTFEKPSDEHAVLPVGKNYWDVDEGVQNPTGGIYSSSADLSKFLRYVLTHYNTIGGMNWLLPSSWATGMNTFTGMPWEIFRTDRILLESKRPVTFVTKSGGLPGYYSLILVLEDYGLGITILVAGNVRLLGEIVEIVTVKLVRAAEALIWQDVEKRYTGSFAAVEDSLNSSLSLASSPAKGLYISRFVSNDTDVLQLVAEGKLGVLSDSDGWHVQLVPTLLYKNETSQQGEIFRMLVVEERSAGKTRVWDEFCITDVDYIKYAGIPIPELVYWHEQSAIELPAWNLTVKATSDDKPDWKMIIQSDL